MYLKCSNFNRSGGAKRLVQGPLEPPASIVALATPLMPKVWLRGRWPKKLSAPWQKGFADEKMRWGIVASWKSSPNTVGYFNRWNRNKLWHLTRTTCSAGVPNNLGQGMANAKVQYRKRWSEFQGVRTLNNQQCGGVWSSWGALNGPECHEQVRQPKIQV